MKRWIKYSAAVCLVVSIWVYLKLTVGDEKGESERKWFVDVTPWYVLICFGCYCLTRLGIGLITFNDYPQETKKLEQVRDSRDTFPLIYSSI
jgi:Dolichol-phosphate mannosyltransferase subunit 3 (DPM3)